MSRSDQRNLALAIVTFLFVNFSIPFAIGHKWSQAGQAARSWPVTTGSTRSIHHTDGYRDLKITYEYGVEGKTYEGSRVRFGLLGDVKELMQSLTNSSMVKVSYHPQDPSTAVLLPDVSPGTKAMKKFGAIGMALSALAAIAVWRYFAGAAKDPAIAPRDSV